MKITDIRTIVVNAQMRNWVFVKVETDTPGLIGWGEASVEWKTRAVAGAVEDLKPFVVGEDPTRIEHIYQKLYRQPFFRRESSASRRSRASNRPAGTSRARRWAFRFTSCSAGPCATRCECTRTSAGAR